MTVCQAARRAGMLSRLTDDEDMEGNRPMSTKLQHLTDIGGPRWSGHEIYRATARDLVADRVHRALEPAMNVRRVDDGEMRLAQIVQRHRIFGT